MSWLIEAEERLLRKLGEYESVYEGVMGSRARLWEGCLIMCGML